MSAMNKLSTRWMDVLAVLLLTVVAVVTHIEWFNLHSILTHGDWLHWSADAMATVGQAWGAWTPFPVGSLGGPNISLSFAPFAWLWQIFTYFGLEPSGSIKLVYFIPLALFSFISPYLYARMRVRPLYAVICALWYGTVIYFLARQTGHATVAFVAALAPLLFAQIDRVLVGAHPFRATAWLALLVTIGIVYEVRIMFLLLPILAVYALYVHTAALVKRWKVIPLFAVLLILLNLYWLLPSVMGGVSDSVGTLANRGLFGGWLVHMRGALTVFDWGWTGGEIISDFVAKPIPSYLWAVPMAALIGLFSISSRKLTKQVLFSFGLLLIGAFLVKQEAEPLRGWYAWAYHNLPGFSLFRESSKFHVITSLGWLGVLVGVGAAQVEGRAAQAVRRGGLIIISLLVLLTAARNVKPLLDKSIGTLFVAKVQPAAYSEWNAQLASDPEFSRVLYLPYLTTWGGFSMLHPRLSAIDFLQGAWEDVVPTAGTDYPAFVRFQQFFARSNWQEQLAEASVRYVVLPPSNPDRNNDIYVHYGSYNSFAALLKDQEGKGLRQILTSEGLVAYEVVSWKPRVTTASGEVRASLQERSGELFAEILPGDKEFIVRDGYSTGWKARTMKGAIATITPRADTTMAVTLSAPATENDRLYVSYRGDEVYWFVRWISLATLAVIIVWVSGITRKKRVQ